ncbi:MAG: hypothetical protein CVV55_03155 [Synergistetes bacterium HGW-Synergistetes-2]|nr:MAG: hypothetical protein CVV55_03155 [Synergistetes bacterium HGW-Synergistetes-2]
MSLTFSPLSIDMRSDYTPLFEKCSEKTSDYTFVNIWAWSDERKYELAFARDLFWPRVTSSAPVYWAPVGNWEATNWESVLPELFPDGMTFDRAPEKLAQLWSERLGDRVTLEEQRSEWEYVYSVEELVALRGNRFHKKKNLLKQFQREYVSEYKSLGRDDVEQILEMQQLWCEWKSCDDIPGLRAENHAISRVLKKWDLLPGLLCGALYVKDYMVAYAVGEPMTDDMVVVHFEKGLAEYKGVYQAINQSFLANSCSGFAWANREQDMGEEGVRKAKESYNPSHFLKKYRAVWKG